MNLSETQKLSLVPFLVTFIVPRYPWGGEWSVSTWSDVLRSHVGTLIVHPPRMPRQAVPRCPHTLQVASQNACISGLLSLLSCCYRYAAVVRGFYVENKAWKQKRIVLNLWTQPHPCHTVCEGCEYLGLSITAVSKPSARAGTGSI